MDQETLVICKEAFAEDEAKYGCGYWSVCLEHDCPCSPTAKVSQGFDPEVWEKLRKEVEDEMEAQRIHYPYDDDDDDFFDDDDFDDDLDDERPWVYDPELGIYYQD